MFRWTRQAGAALALALAAGCGGGSSNDNEHTSPPLAKVTSAEGFWTGRSSTGYDVAVAVLDDGATWGAYSRDGIIHGAMHGTTISADGRLHGSGAEFDVAANQVASRAYEGTYVAQKDIRIWFGFDAFSGVYSPSYGQPVALAQLAGTYRGMGVSTGAANRPVTLSISEHGAVATEPMQGCTARGSVAPRPGGKNIFDLRLVFAGDACALGHGAIATGVAHYDNGRLMALGLLPSQVQGFIFQGARAVQPPASRTTAEGFWTGKASTGFNVAVAILDNGDTWGMFLDDAWNIHGALHGSTASAQGQLQGFGREVHFGTGQVSSSAYRGIYVAEHELHVQLSGNVVFSGAYSAAYDRPASTAELAGTYRGTAAVSGGPIQPVVVTITSTGQLHSPTALGCTTRGTIRPRAGGKNVFDFQATFLGAHCALGNGGTVSGVTYHENGQLIAMGLTPSQEGGFFFTGKR